MVLERTFPIINKIVCEKRQEDAPVVERVENQPDRGEKVCRRSLSENRISPSLALNAGQRFLAVPTLFLVYLRKSYL